MQAGTIPLARFVLTRLSRKTHKENGGLVRQKEEEEKQDERMDMVPRRCIMGNFAGLYCQKEGKKILGILLV